MTTTTHPPTTDPAGLVCPPWCTLAEHDDMEKSGRDVENGTYDPRLGGYCHHGDEVIVSTGDDEVALWLTSYLTFDAGIDLEPPVLFLNGHELTRTQARDLAATILALVEQAETADAARTNWQPKGGRA
jgi:hypothetical protein